ncbi:MAG: hypothetical protein VXY89_11875, partial [SAR324 cluster bacterium]|nr:hypothetical protein [SAR324 cluster bacterium]
KLAMIRRLFIEDSLVQFVDLPPADCRSFPMPRLNYLVRFVRLFRIFLFCVPDSKDSGVVSMVPITSDCSEAVLAGNLSRLLERKISTQKPSGSS